MRLFIKAISVLAMTIPTLYAQTSLPSGWATLLDTNYRFEVAGYCGLVTEGVIRGFKEEVRSLSQQHNLPAESQLEASGKGWQAAHKEWLNRGLGGYKRWCRNEGQTYAAQFLNSDSASE